ncbi:unnamed protein product [Prorocentrum cordatum]|uniref:Uncharacterized protein n=1 Tax=Prorocentrum cordatum TaxID=2364126 RepID=A0ABN9PJU2_9DINO|nr:unnamed protein product [Polarella glacialis]
MPLASRAAGRNIRGDPQLWACCGLGNYGAAHWLLPDPSRASPWPLRRPSTSSPPVREEGRCDPRPTALLREGVLAHGRSGTQRRREAARQNLCKRAPEPLLTDLPDLLHAIRDTVQVKRGEGKR